MLAVKRYDPAYVDGCEARTKARVAAYRSLVAAAKGSGPGRKAAEKCDPLFFGALLLALDAAFIHRTRAIEGKDGNPLNEVRMLCASILSHGSMLTADKTIRYESADSVLKIPLGAPIELDARRFSALSRAFFAELRARFG